MYNFNSRFLICLQMVCFFALIFVLGCLVMKRDECKACVVKFDPDLRGLEKDIKLLWLSKIVF